MIVDNINFLKQSYNNEYNRLKEFEKTINASNFSIDTAQNGEDSLYLNKDEYHHRLHSSFDPTKEAEDILSQYNNIKNYDNILIFGTGLGYHIDHIVKMYPNKKIYIYEPSYELFYFYTKSKIIPQKNIENICIGDDTSSRNDFIQDILTKTGKKVLIIELPVYKEVFRKDYESFMDMFSKLLKHKRSGLHTNYAFQKRWIVNGMKNFKEVLKSPNILTNKRGQFTDKTAILVAAGPSLDEEMDNLKHIIDNGLAYVFSAGWSISTLLKNNLIPHAFTSYDPTVLNQRVFKIIGDQSEKFPLVFGSTIGHECIDLFKGPKLHMITSQDTTATYYLKAEDDKKIDLVIDAPNIAVITLQLLVKLGFNKIILVGQNFAYKEDKVIASGYTGPELAKGNLKVKSVYGDMITTEEKFNGMRSQMEMHIRELKNVEVINSTKGGAHIEGTSFKHLEDIISEYLTEPIYDKTWFESDEIGYDTNYLSDRMKLMNKDQYDFSHEIEEVKEMLGKIKSLVRNQNFKQSDKMYLKLDEIFNSIKKNNFFDRFILPMNRVFYDIFASEIQSVRFDNNRIKKAEVVTNAFGKFVFECEKDVEKAKLIVNQINESIINYIENKDNK